jgi:HEAT repeat protein
LSALGPLAIPALPELQRLLYTNYWHSAIKSAAYALAAMGPEGADILTNAVQPQTEWSGMCAIWALGQHPATGTNYIPFLLTVTTSKSEGMASGALQVLGLFHSDAEHVIPALTNVLAGTNSELSQCAARALGQFGRQASSALPLLRSTTNNPAVRDAALQALRQIQ